jgi:8-oxo-dGTP pyrophosphatase MutT (NUDIX family)
MAYKSFAAGYLVKDGKVLLVHHKKFNKWTPPGGHIEENETPAEAVVRELKEETSLSVEVMPAYKNGFKSDLNCAPMPMPFHIGLYREDFDVPHIGYFFFIKVLDGNYKLKVLESESLGLGWFGLEELKDLETYNQVKLECKYAIENYPKITL